MKRTILVHAIILAAFLFNILGPLPFAQAQERPPIAYSATGEDFRLPAPGGMVHLSPIFNPPILKGIKVYPDNPFRFDFILNKGDSAKRPNTSDGVKLSLSTGPAKRSQEEQLKSEAVRLIKYFLASLTIPEKDLWVNLSPYEKGRIIPNSFGLTEMGRDLLAEDYMLKQITASLIYPEDEIGKKFWKRVYEEAAKKYGTTNIPVDTFNKVWIVPEKAVVYENAKAGTAYVIESKLKVMLEQDYLSFKKHETIHSSQSRAKNTNQLGSQIVREVVIPELTKEVNENKNFSQLRQVYNSLILATWYKKKIKDSILEQVYADRQKVFGANIDGPQETQKIYQQYLQAFKKGVFNYIKNEAFFIPGMPSKKQEILPRKYFSGGVTLLDMSMMTIVHVLPQANSVNSPDVYWIRKDFQSLPEEGNNSFDSAMSADNAGMQEIVLESDRYQQKKSVSGFNAVIKLENLLNTESGLEVPGAVVNALVSIYVKMVEQGHMTLDTLEGRLNTEGNWRIREAIIIAQSKIYLKMFELGQKVSLGVLEDRMNTDGYTVVRQAAINALLPLYLKMLEQGQNVPVDTLIKYLNTEKTDYVRRTLVKALGLLYLKLLEQGQKVSLDVFESRIKSDEQQIVKIGILNELGPLYIKMVEQGQMTLKALENRFKKEKEWRIRQAIVNALGHLYLEKIEQGQEVSLDMLESSLKTVGDTRLEAIIIKALSSLYLKMIMLGQKVSLDTLENYLKWPTNNDVMKEIITALIPIYFKKIELGQMTFGEMKNRLDIKSSYLEYVSTNVLGSQDLKMVGLGRMTLGELEGRFNAEQEWVARKAVVNELGTRYLKMVGQRQDVPLSVLEGFLSTERDKYVRQAIVKVLGSLYLKLVEQGHNVSLNMFESLLWTEGQVIVREPIVSALGSIYLKILERGQRVSLEPLERRLQREKECIQAIIDALVPLYIKMVDRGYMTLDALENNLKIEGIENRKIAIVKTLGHFYLKAVEQRDKDDGQEGYKFWNRFQLSSLGLNTWVLDRTLSLSPESLRDNEKLFVQILGAFRDSNAKLDEGRRLSEDTFRTEYLPLIYFLEVLLPNKGAKYVMYDLRNNRGPGGVIKFLNGIRSVLTDGDVTAVLHQLINRMADEHGKGTRKKFKVDEMAFFKTLNLCSAFIDLEASQRLVEKFNTTGASESFKEINKQLESDFLNYLAEYFEIKPGSIDLNIRNSLYTPFLSRIREALQFVRKYKFLKYEQFKALIRAAFEGRFWDFIENEKQSDEQGLAIARHNALVRDALKKVGINTDRWLGRPGHRMPDEDYIYYEESSTAGYDPINDARSVKEYLQRVLGASITQEQRNHLMDYLQSIGLLVNRDEQGKVSGIKTMDAGKKNDVISVLSKPANIEGLLKIQQELLKVDNIHNAASLLEIVTHWGERIEILKGRLTNEEYQNGFTKQRQYFRIRPILRNPGHDLFIGDFTNCCLGMNSSQYPDAMMERLIDEGLNVLEVIDESTMKTMAAAWVYIAEDGSLVVQNLEINTGYERTKPLMDKVGALMVEYARQFAVYIGAKRLLIGKPEHGKYFDTGGYIDIRYRKKEVPYGLEKIGGYLGEKYYLDSAGKPTAYLVEDFTKIKGPIEKIGSTNNDVEVRVDLAMVTQVKKDHGFHQKYNFGRTKSANSPDGGVDLTVVNKVLQNINNGESIKFRLDPALLRQFKNSPGLMVGNITILPLKDLLEFLGLYQA